MLQQKFLQFFNSSGDNENYLVLFTWRNKNLLLRVYFSFHLILIFLEEMRKKGEADRGRKKYLEIIVSEKVRDRSKEMRTMGKLLERMIKQINF